jgi:hypothetical protein
LLCDHASIAVKPPQLGAGAMLLDVRLYKLHAGKRDEFDALVRHETIPMARRYGQRIVDFGPSAHDADTYYLIRAFTSAEDRARTLASFYGSEEWRRKYDDRVMALIDSYQTAVFATSPDAVRHLSEARRAGVES